MLGQQTLTVVRQAAGSRVDGVFTPGAESTFTIVGSIQPLTGRELELLPEGERAREHRKLYVQPAAELQTVAADGETMPDQVVYDGRRWEVHTDSTYDSATGGALSHSKYRIVAVQDDALDEA